MKVYRLAIRRFKGLKEIDFDIRPGLQLVAGPNSCGKSTLLRAIEAFFTQSESDLPLESFAPQNAYYEQEGKRALSTIKLHFTDLTESENESFKDAVDQKGNFWCERRVSRRGTVSYDASKNQNGSEIHEKILARYSLLHIPALRIGAEGVSSGESERLVQALSEVIVRMRPGPETATQKKFSKIFDETCLLVKEVFGGSQTAVKDLLPDSLGLSFEAPGKVSLARTILSQIQIHTTASHKTHLKNEGTGIQSLLAIGLLDYVRKRTRKDHNLLFLIEEPEAFLHPQYQRAVASRIKDLASQTQAIVTTHSPTVVDSTSVNEIARMSRDRNGLVWEWNPSPLGETDEGKLSRYCDAKNSEIVFASKVVFCEGQTDRNVILALLKRSRIDPDLKNVSVVEIGGKDAAERFKDLSERFRIDYLFVFDSDFHIGRRDSMKKVILDQTVKDQVYGVSDRIKQNSPNSMQVAATQRNEINQLLQSHRVFCLRSDMEGSVLSSLKKEKLLKLLASNSGCDSNTIAELNQKSGINLIQALFKTFGSRGWNVSARRCPPSKRRLEPRSSSNA